MRSTTLTAIGLSLALATPCLAQSSQSSPSPPASAAQPLIKGKPGTESGRAPGAPGTQQQAQAQQPASQGGSQSTRPQVTQSQSSDQQGTLQTGMGQPAPSSATASGSAGAPIQQQMKRDLEQAGFTDVKIMPELFLIRAHDKQGRPVMMVVNPDSVLAMTKAGGSNAPTTTQ